MINYGSAQWYKTLFYFKLEKDPNKSPIKYCTSLFSFISTPRAELVAIHHIMMTETASLLRGTWFPKIRCKRHDFSSFCNAAFLFLWRKTISRWIVDKNCFNLSQNRPMIPAHYSKHEICINMSVLQAYASPTYYGCLGREELIF